jgi:hypothetical protein
MKVPAYLQSNRYHESVLGAEFRIKFHDSVSSFISQFFCFPAENHSNVSQPQKISPYYLKQIGKTNCRGKTYFDGHE